MVQALLHVVQHIFLAFNKNIPSNHWHAYIQDNLIASTHTIADPNGKFVHQKVVSNGFNSTAIISDNDHLGISFILIFYQN